MCPGPSPRPGAVGVVPQKRCGAGARRAALWLRHGALRLHVGSADMSLRRKAADLPAANAGLTGQPLPAECLVASARRIAPSHRQCRCEPAPQGCRFTCGECWPYRPAAARSAAALSGFWSSFTSLARYELRPRTDTAYARRAYSPAAALWLRPGALRLHVSRADMSLRRKASDLPPANAGLTGQPLHAALQPGLLVCAHIAGAI